MAAVSSGKKMLAGSLLQLKDDKWAVIEKKTLIKDGETFKLLVRD